MFCCSSDTLVENGRAGSVEGVIKAFATIMAAVRGEVICEVTTAKVMWYGVVALCIGGHLFDAYKRL